ncbi:NeuB family protein [uncultured archaeon]|nr:NeuB family protein [uncultured archaeon]
MAEKIIIGDRSIGEGQKIFIIAEAGVDHKGDMDQAKKIIEAAKKAGADAVKFQTYYADKLVTPEAKCYWHLVPEDDPSTRQIDTFGNLDKLRRDIYTELIEYGKKIGILVFSTPFDEDAVDVLVDSGVLAIKIASGDITCHSLLKRAAQKGVPILLSTGAATHNEVDEALKVIKDNGNPQVALLHCILDYPTKDEDSNLRAIQEYRERYNLPIGFSDHTLTRDSGVLACFYGASFLEKHCTINKFKGEEGKPLNPDASFMSMEEFAEYVRRVRDFEEGKLTKEILEKELGVVFEKMSGIKNPERPLTCEYAASIGARRSLVSKKAIKSGEIIKEEDLDWKRPATGIKPTLENIKYVSGRTALVDIPKDKVISYPMIDNS